MYTPKRDVAMFRCENDIIIPQVLAKGPWYPNSQHGSSMIAIMARAAEIYPSETPRFVSRLTVDMMRAAPMSAHEIKCNVRRGGKNVEFLDLELIANEETFLSASAMRIRKSEIQVNPYFQGLKPFPSLSENNVHDFFDFPGSEEPAFHHAIDLKIDEHEGVPIIWFRLAVPLVEGELITPYQRVAAACDWTYAVPNIGYRYKNQLAFSDLTFSGINPDTTINFFREPQGEWIGLKSQASYGYEGSGCASAQIFDELGPVGFSSQSVLIRPVEHLPEHHKKK